MQKQKEDAESFGTELRIIYSIVHICIVHERDIRIANSMEVALKEYKTDSKFRFLRVCYS